MNSKEWKRWLFWFTFAVAAIVVYKTIDSVAEIFVAIGRFFDILKPFLMAFLVSKTLTSMVCCPKGKPIAAPT